MASVAGAARPARNRFVHGPESVTVRPMYKSRFLSAAVEAVKAKVGGVLARNSVTHGTDGQNTRPTRRVASGGAPELGAGRSPEGGLRGEAPGGSRPSARRVAARGRRGNACHPPAEFYILNILSISKSSGRRRARKKQPCTGV